MRTVTPATVMLQNNGPLKLIVSKLYPFYNFKTIIDIFMKLETNIKNFRVVLGWAYRGLTGGFLLLQNFCVAISVSPHVCFILVLILISMFLR